MEYKKLIRHRRTYDYFDGPQSFLAVEALDMKYFCVLVDIRDGSRQYVCTPISSWRLSEFHEGRYDIRRLFEERETSELYALFDISEADSAYLTPIEEERLPEDWMPDAGLYFEGVTDQTVMKEVAERYRAIIHLSLSPPESNGEFKINALHLSEGLWLFQNLVKHSYKKAIQRSPDRLELDRPDNYEMEVFATSPGSFTLHMQSVASTDLLGNFRVEHSLSCIDELLQSANGPNMFEIFRRYKGHVIRSYRRLLEFIIKQRTSISYEWSVPHMKNTVKQHISRDFAEPILDLLNMKEELSSETRVFTGKVMRVDVIKGRWSILSEDDNKLYHGVVKDVTIHLGGITTETKMYRFYCEERIEEESISGKEKTSLYLHSYNEL